MGDKETKADTLRQGLGRTRRGRLLTIPTPSETEARYWLEQWREGAKPKQETRIRKIVIRRNRKEVKE